MWPVNRDTRMMPHKFIQISWKCFNIIEFFRPNDKCNKITENIKLCWRGADTCAWPLVHCCDLDINPITLKLEGDLDILKMYLHTEHEAARLKHSKLIIMDEMCMSRGLTSHSTHGVDEMRMSRGLTSHSTHGVDEMCMSRGLTSHSTHGVDEMCMANEKNMKTARGQMSPTFNHF